MAADTNNAEGVDGNFASVLQFYVEAGILKAHFQV